MPKDRTEELAEKIAKFCRGDEPGTILAALQLAAAEVIVFRGKAEKDEAIVKEFDRTLRVAVEAMRQHNGEHSGLTPAGAKN